MSRYLRSILISVGLLLVIVFLGQLNVLRPLEHLVVAVLRPVQQQSFIAGSWLGNLVRRVETENELKQNVRSLQDEIQRLRQENSQLSLLLEEIDATKKLDQFFSERNIQFEPAQIIGKSADAIENVLILNRGERNGVQEGYAVVSKEGTVVGTILDTTALTSTLILVTDQASMIGGEVQNGTGAQGIVQGQRGLSVQLQLVPQTEVIEPGQLVVTSGIEPTIPRGLVIGRLSSITTINEELFQESTVVQDVSLQTLTNVAVVIPIEGDIL